MKIYNPSIPPKAEVWLELDEQHRLVLINNFVEYYEQDIEKETRGIHTEYT